MTTKTHKRRITLNFGLRDARNLNGHLKDTFATSSERAVTLQKTRKKLDHQLNKAAASRTASPVNPANN